MSKKEKKLSVTMVASIAILIAIEVVLSRFMSISTQQIKIGFAFIPVAFAGYKYGKSAGALVGGLSDLIGALLFPIGTYFPGFTFTAALIGCCFGLFLHRNKLTIKNIVFAVLITQIFGSLLLNSLWISILYSTPYVSLLVTRSIQIAVMIAVEIVVLPLLLKSIDKSIKKAIVQ